jgi:hypothetical protein
MRSLPLLVLLALGLSGCRSAPVDGPMPAAPVLAVDTALVREPFEVDLGGWTTQAELVHPNAAGPHGGGPWPVVLLLSGNGPHDMDVTLPGPNGSVKLFAQLGDVLAARGCAVVRYHKRFVKGPGRFDARFWKQQSTVQFTADAGRVLARALQFAACDPQRVFVYGWSEGTAVAAQLACDRGDIRGLVLQGPVGLPWREMVRGWIVDVGLPYAQGADGGVITAGELAAAQRGPGGAVAKLAASFFTEPGAFGAPVKVNVRLDQNGDSVLDPTDEVLPQVDAMLDFAFAPGGNAYIYADGRTVPTVTEQAPRLSMPVLILQGEHDASTPQRGAHALAAALRAAGNQDVTLSVLPGAGHTLGPAASMIDDCGRAPAEAALVPIAQWLAARAGRR